MRQLVLLLAALSLVANTKQSSDPRNSTTSAWDSTTTAASTTTTSGPICPLGWIDGDDLGCFLFSPQMVGLSWIEAIEYCEEQVCVYFHSIGILNDFFRMVSWPNPRPRRS